MNFENRIKAEMTQGIVKAILDDAGYRVVRLGIEDTLRELVCLNINEYGSLNIPDTIRKLPDYAVFDRAMTKKWLVEIKYRAHWDYSIFREMNDQVRVFKDVILIYVNANPDMSCSSFPTPTSSSYIRCIRLTYGENVKIHRREKGGGVLIEDIEAHSDFAKKNMYWGFHKMEEIFDGLVITKEDKTLEKAINALRGIVG